MNELPLKPQLNIPVVNAQPFFHGSLFSGIGGFDLAAEWAGWQNVFHCEWNEFGQKILNYYWPKAISYDDITKTDFTIHRGTIDVLTGGFPCQPFSQSGAQKGEDDERYLFPEMFRAIREIKAPWIVAENVYGITTRKFREVFETICSSLEAEGYEVQPVIIPASAVGAPHERDRVWFVAYNSNAGFENMRQKWQNSIYRPGFITNPNGAPTENEIQARGNEFNGKTITNSNQLNGDLSGFHSSWISQFEKAGIFQNNITDTIGFGLRGQSNWLGKSGFVNSQGPESYWGNFPTQSPICSRNDGISFGLDDITFSKWRNESIKGLGNAIVPQVAVQIFEAIQTAALADEARWQKILKICPQTSINSTETACI